MSGIVHCPRCGHHINIPSNGAAGYCPICDKEVSDMEKRTIWVKSSCFNGYAIELDEPEGFIKVGHIDGVINKRSQPTK